MSATAIHALAIAPYESMKKGLMHVAESFPGMELDVHLGDLEEGAEIVRRLCEEHAYDVIISRGGTAEQIRGVTGIPVISIAISVYDVLRTIRLAQNYSGRCAIVGFSGITEPAHILCDMLRYRIDILTIHSQEEVLETLTRLKKLSIQAVVCDAVTHRTAREIGLSAFLVVSGEESLHDALKQAESIGAIFRQMRREQSLLRLQIRNEPANAVILDESGSVLSASHSSPTPRLLAAMRQNLRSIRAGSNVRFYHREQNELHAVTGQAETYEGRGVYLFFDTPAQIPMRAGRLGLRFLDRAECEQLFMSSFYAISGAMGELEERLPAIAEARQSLLILGEEGTGREQIAKALYLKSRLANRPFTVVDCAQMDNRTWEYLLEHHNSPLMDRDCTVYFQHLDALSEERWPMLIYNIVETGLAKRIWLLFSCTVVEGQPVPERVKQFASQVGCQLLQLPALRNRLDELPSLASLYLSSLNVELGKQLLGFDPSAMDQLIHYSWPNNYTQFKHVLEELAAQAQGSYISSNACYEVLRKERRLNREAPMDAQSDGVRYKNRTLEEINAEVAQRALADNGGNQTATARQLGVSRTTLWRMMRIAKPTRPDDR